MTRNDIQFKNGSSNDLGRGYGNGNPKISYKIAGYQPRWKSIYRGDDQMGEFLSQLVTDFLNSDEVKDKIIESLTSKK